MFDNAASKNLQRVGQEDILARAIRIGLSTCGPVGAVVSEFLTEFVPQQRVDRLQDYVAQLADRVRGCEEQLKERLASSAAFAALAEQVTVAAVRSPSDTRRKDLAELLRTGLSKEDADIVAHQALLRLLDQVNDVQLLMLMQYGSFRQFMGNTELQAFMKRHPEVFVQPPGIGDPEDGRQQRWAMFRHYEASLEALGLLKDTEGVVKSPVRVMKITELGYMLLEAIGRPVERM